MIDKWDRDYLALARWWAERKSKDPSTQVGAVIVRPDKTIAAMGYNGFPRRCDDSPALYADRATKYSRVVHGEMNAILTAREPLHGYTLYTTPFMPCDRCAGMVIQAGILRVVAPALDAERAARWADTMAKAMQLFHEAGVALEFAADDGMQEAA